MKNGLVSLKALGLAAALALPVSGPALAGKKDDILHVVWRVSVPNLDPQHNNLREGVVVGQLVWDTLVYKNPDSGAFEPLLADSWNWVDNTTIEFKLKRGVKFHNGDDFSADDVVYTLNYVANPASKLSVPGNGSWIEKAEKVDDFTVRVTLKKPFPAAMEYFAVPLLIYPAKYHAKVGPEGMGKAPVGTGPYKAVTIDGVKRYLLERNEAGVPGSPKGRAKIGKVEIRTVTDSAAEVVELLAGRADWIWKFNSDQFDKLGKMPRIAASRDESMRIGFLLLDAVAPGDNPLAKQQVRQAINHAIDREKFVKYLVQGSARVIDAPCYPAQFGCDMAAAVRYAYDPAKAKALLAEAGYPNGFTTQMVGFRSAQWTAAIQNDLAAVGIKAQVSMVEGAVLVEKTKKGEAPVAHWDWGSLSVNDASAVLPNFFGDEGYDRAQDKEVKALLDKAGSSVDQAERKALYARAIKLITERAYSVPLHTFTINYAYNRELDFKAYPDELPRFYQYGWK